MQALATDDKILPLHLQIKLMLFMIRCCLILVTRTQRADGAHISAGYVFRGTYVTFS